MSMDEERHSYTLFGGRRRSNHCLSPKRDSERSSYLTIDALLTELYSSGKSFLHFIIVRLTFPYLLGLNLALAIVHDHGVIHGSLSGVRITRFCRTTLNHVMLLVEYLHRRSRTSMCGRLRNGSSTDGVFQRDLLLFVHRRRSTMDWTRTLPITRQIKEFCRFP